jgi:hypothetical protein
MRMQPEKVILSRCGTFFALPIMFVLAVAAPARSAAQQQTVPHPAPGAAPSAFGCTLPAAPPRDDDKTPPRITPDQANRLFAMVDLLIKFSSDETGLPIKSQVKRQLTTRDAVVQYLEDKFKEDEGTKRLERDEIVLKKFGLLDRDFDLKPFLLDLLKEQIEAYYDAKTKTVNLLDWIGPDEQQPVLAHELTHALQDQHSDLEKWDNQTPDDVSTNWSGDQDHLARDEIDTARDAVAEGQATVVMWDCLLKPMGKSLVKDPEVLDLLKAQMIAGEDSPVMARAPLLISESVLFPYREGMSFEQDVWMDQGQTAAFAGALDHPPTSSWEIINPREYEKKSVPPVPLMPDIHPLVDAAYKPYDIGQVGELDVQILSALLGGDNAARDLTPAWNGGLYWAGQLRTATAAQQADTASIGLLYLSVWKTAASADVFARIYANSLGRKYSYVNEISAGVSARDASPAGTVERLFTTNEGPVAITTRGKMVFISESFPLPLARKLTALLLDAQGVGPVHMAVRPLAPANSDAHASALSADLVRFFAQAGVLKAGVDAERLAIERRPAP